MGYPKLSDVFLLLWRIKLSGGLDENGTREHDRDPHREEPGRDAHECTATVVAGWCVARRTTEHREACSGTIMDSRRPAAAS